MRSSTYKESARRDPVPATRAPARVQEVRARARTLVAMVMRPGGRRRRGIVIVAVLVVLFFLLTSARFYTDVLWFQEIGFEDVLWTSLRTQFLVGALVGLVVAIVIWLNLTLASRIAPVHRVSGLEVVGREDPMDRYREGLAPYVGALRWAIALGIGLLTGLSASGSWRTFLLWVNRVDFGIDDPLFSRDIGFYVFELPFLNLILSWAWFALIVALLLSLGAHYFYGSIRPEARLGGVSSGALAHISVLLGLLALVKAGQYLLGQYSLNFSPRGVVTGASYTDVNAQLPALRLLVIISVISAILFLVNIRFRRMSLPLAAVGIWILTSVLAGGVWPFFVQRFSVEPQEFRRERSFIADNISATREAFGLEEVQIEDFLAETEVASETVQQNADLLSNVRLWDPGVLEQAYAQLQAIRTYYQFTDVDIDRYEVSGEMRQVLLSARELSLEDLTDRSWSNEHLQYTHGFGLVSSLANEATSSGQPSFLVRDVPGTPAAGAEALQPDEPRLYYGESFDSDEYSVVDTEQSEVDFPTGSNDVQRSQYQGEGGVSVSNFFTRLAFAVRETDPNLVLSNLITGDSQILFYRNVRERVLRAAPFLSLDHDPYPAVADGRLVWIIDAYTTTQYYPYAQRFDLEGIVSSVEAGGLSGRINYVRNSVKVVVDAYDGNMKFYVVDEGDPIIQAWRNAFPSLFVPQDEEPSADLQAHFRYPEDLFEVQSEVFLNYHVTDPANFYAKEDAWQVPQSTTTTDEIGTLIAGEVPPTYLLIKLPGETEQEFVLTRPFTPRGKNNMIAVMAARSDPENYGELLTLRFPSQRTVLGPTQVDNLINQDVAISQALTLLGQRGSRVSFGSLVILPIEESILYVQPLFVQAETGGIPELKKVIVVSGDRVVMADSFDAALTDLFGIGETVEPPPSPPDGGGGGDGGGGPTDPAVNEIIARAGRVYDQAQEALAAGDFETYARLIERLGGLLDQAGALDQQ